MDEQGFRGFRGPPKPVEVGQEYDVDIKEMSRRGDGIARIEGFVVFVPKTQIGDHVKMRVIRVGSRFAEADVVSEAVAEEKEEKEE